MERPNSIQANLTQLKLGGLGERFLGLRLIERSDDRSYRATPFGAPHVSERPATDRGPKLATMAPKGGAKKAKKVRPASG